jgi:4-hydroxyphenylpyruvate dioxygenase
MRRAESKLQLAQTLGAPCILLCANVATATRPDPEVAVAQLRALGDLAESYGVRVAYEALAWSRYVPTYEQAWELVEAVDHPFVGLCLDSFHLFSSTSTLDRISTIPGAKIFFCQLADAPTLTLDPLSWSRHHRLFPGQGNFDLVGFTDAVMRAGYQGPLSLEVFNDVFRQSDPRRTAVDAQRSLRYLQDVVRRRTDTMPEASQSRLDRLTPVPPAERFDFIEIRSGQDPELLTTLQALGFEHHGRHQTKSVDLWKQRDVHLIINDTAPTASVPMVAAIGVPVESPEAAARRADQLLAPAVERVTAADEAMLHAVRAPDSTEVYFCDAHPDGPPTWLREFGGEDRAGLSDAGLVDIDHLALAQPWQHFDEAVLFYRSMLGLHADESLDVPDPNGLVRSQVMASSTNGIRLALNVLPTSLASAPQTPARGNTEHVAFRSEDLLETSRILRERGLETLEIPDNYYADLRARFGLALDRVEELQAANILFDRDASGTFLQLYTRSIGNIFFEVVERVDGYSGFGAANAPIRRAAQNRTAKPGTWSPQAGSARR